MKFLRGLFVLVLFGFILFGLWSWYSSEKTISEKDTTLPVWESVATWFQSLGAVGSDGQPKDSIAKVDPSLEIGTPSIPDQNDTVETNEDDVDSPSPTTFHPDVTFGQREQESWESYTNGFVSLGEQNTIFEAIVYCAQSIDYCRDQLQKQVMEGFNDILDNQLTYIYVPFALSFSGDELFAQSVYLCAQSTSTEAQVRALTQFLSTQPRQRDLEDYVESINIKYDESCPTDPVTTAQLRELRETARNEFDVTQLPTVIIRNTQTDDFRKIPGIYTDEEINNSIKRIGESAQ